MNSPDLIFAIILGVLISSAIAPFLTIKIYFNRRHKTGIWNREKGMAEWE